MISGQAVRHSPEPLSQCPCPGPGSYVSAVESQSLCRFTTYLDHRPPALWPNTARTGEAAAAEDAEAAESKHQARRLILLRALCGGLT